MYVQCIHNVQLLVKFYFANIHGNPTSPYPKPNYSGNWKLLKAFITPLADHKFSRTYKVGRNKEKSETRSAMLGT